MNGFLYTAAAAAMVILCVIGITTMNNYEKMKQVQQSLAVLSQSTEKEKDGVEVESVPGEVTPENQQEDTDLDSQNPGQQEEEQPSTGQNTDGQSTDSPDSQTSAGQTTDGQDSPSTGGTTENPSAEGQATDAAAIAKTYLDQGYYIVQPGDKLELICKKIYQTTAMMDKLMEANDIEDADKIYAGQKLLLP